jgi:hypothetical protein
MDGLGEWKRYISLNTVVAIQMSTLPWRKLTGSSSSIPPPLFFSTHPDLTSSGVSFGDPLSFSAAIVCQSPSTCRTSDQRRLQSRSRSRKAPYRSTFRRRHSSCSQPHSHLDYERSGATRNKMACSWMFSENLLVAEGSSITSYLS